jgi:hypothetical protein
MKGRPSECFASVVDFDELIPDGVVESEFLNAGDYLPMT